ncbi:MAG TPA: PA0069 family radical SAM protein [Bacteroidia bacterium]|nr:PA0069 family radical SAM protein [Bacteroidia bacterium]
MAKDRNTDNLIKGRGAQLNTRNKYLRQELVTEHIEGLDEPLNLSGATQYFTEYPKKMINRIDSPDIPSDFSMNPYQGCEHGCVYCYARNTHQYWGYSAGIDFESRIIVKPHAAALLETELRKKSWKPSVIMLSGNTDCYQPAEKKWKLTRRMLEVLLRFRNPVSMITKNQLILRDLDLIRELATMDLIHVAVSITTLDEDLRLQLEPRTATAKNRLKVIETLSSYDIPVIVMVAPVIPGLNSHEIPAIIEAAANSGARNAGMTIVRLNDSVATIFSDWIKKSFPDRAEKVLNLIAECHGGKLNDSRFGTRMKGEGEVAESIRQLFTQSVGRFMKGRKIPPYNKTLFRIPSIGGQMDLFSEI